jgi:excisionase family DNA binding protein
MSTEPKTPKVPKRTSPDLLDYRQAADRLNCSEASVRRLVDAGKIKSVAVSPSGRKRMIRIVDLESYLEDNSGYRQSPPDVSNPMRSSTMDSALRKAGWDGKDHLGYDRKPRK